MRSEQLAMDNYETEKIENRFFEYYDPLFGPLINKKITLLEIGVKKGGSILLWRDYFPQGTIVGIDIKEPNNVKFGERIHFFKGSQTDLAFLTDVRKRVAPEGFDIIIDDASHIAELTKKAFWHLFDNHLKPGGLYAIEDWGTGYWDDWADGKCFDAKQINSHNYGMVGFIKELVDEQGMADLTKAGVKGKPTRQSKFESLLIVPAIAFVRKAS